MFWIPTHSFLKNKCMQDKNTMSLAPDNYSSEES